MSEKAPSLSQRYATVTETLIEMSESVSRVDERVGNLIEKLRTVEEGQIRHTETCTARSEFPALLARLSVIESKNGKILREELLQHITEVKQAVQRLESETRQAIQHVEGEAKQAALRLDTDVKGLEKTALHLKNATEEHAKWWKWIGLFLFNFMFNLAALIGAGYLLHLWQITK